MLTNTVDKSDLVKYCSQHPVSLSDKLTSMKMIKYNLDYPLVFVKTRIKMIKHTEKRPYSFNTGINVLKHCIINK